MKLTPLNSTALPASTQTAGLLVVATATTMFLMKKTVKGKKVNVLRVGGGAGNYFISYAYKEIS
ncbi:hypothetical protein [Lactobacillus amylovorus]|uniref:hypothetical protein n=1 Tax=Lactobacillus amylovorus TaxID=1604 RepID=UPI001F5AA9DD|nr:hypothetical protein [Lactobacillus amylovorus]